MRNYLLKAPDHQWNASSPAKSSIQNLKIQYLGTAGFILSDSTSNYSFGSFY